MKNYPQLKNFLEKLSSYELHVAINSMKISLFTQIGHSVASGVLRSPLFLPNKNHGFTVKDSSLGLEHTSGIKENLINVPTDETLAVIEAGNMPKPTESTNKTLTYQQGLYANYGEIERSASVDPFASFRIDK